MSKSSLVNEYNALNSKTTNKKVFQQTIDISFLDILSESNVEVVIKDYKDCLCKDSKHRHNYYKECDKCNGSGTIVLNGHTLICNECKGEKIIRVNNCYVCNNEGKLLLDSKTKIKLNKNIKEGNEIIIEGEGYSLVLKVHIYDQEEYLIRGKDIYKLKSIIYTKQDYSNKIKKQIKTLKGTSYIESEFKKKKEVIRLENKGIDDGDFYFIFENEVDNEKEIIYSNVFIGESGYVNVESLIKDLYVMSKDIVALNEECIYINKDTKKIETDDYIVYLNVLNKDEYEFEDNKVYYILNLTKEDLTLDKKSITINEEKINVNFKKNLKESMQVIANNKVLVDKKGKKIDLIIKINPYFENIYKIKIKRNKNAVYIEDYKYDDYRLVDTFKKNDYLDEYIKVDKEDKVYIDDNLVLIKRV